LDAFIHHKKSLLAVVNLLADCAYTGQSFADGVAEILGAKVAISKRNEILWRLMSTLPLVDSALMKRPSPM
jgi:transposase